MEDFTRLSHRKRYIVGNRPVSSAVDKEILHGLGGSRRLWVVRFECSCWAGNVSGLLRFELGVGASYRALSREPL